MLGRCGRASLGYEKREAGFRCLAWSLEAGLTRVNAMRLVSDEASRLSVHNPFGGVPCTDPCTRLSNGPGTLGQGSAILDAVVGGVG
jgi:hypothetical protein